VAGAATTLDAADDTDNNANDFVLATPAPKNNAGATGTPPTSICGNNTIEGLESCDDNNTASNDGCSSTCFTEACGDGIVQTNEQCDDANSSTTDTCSTTCMTQVATVDGVIDAGVSDAAGGDAGNAETGGGGGCCQTGTAGNAPWLAPLVLGLLWRRRRRPLDVRRTTP
jgi:MYXO-CTERM domain-containing protein